MTIGRRALALSLGVALAAAGPAAAQASGDGYLFGVPPAVLTVHGGFARASAGSDLFSFSTEQLTLERGDFSGPSIGGELAVRLWPRLDVALGVEYAGRSASSESRGYVGTDDLPILQTTTFQRVPATVGARAYLTERGRSVGRFAWVPARAAPFVEAGGGLMWYRFHQEGEFVDYETLDIFADEFDSRGSAPTAYAGAGVDVTLTPRFGLTARTRYTWAEAGLESSFEDFEEIDLSGFAASVGINLRF
jgi:hypothetical protein